MDDKRIQEAKEMLDKLHDRMDENGSLNEWEQNFFDILSWLLDGTTKPDID